MGSTPFHVDANVRHQAASRRKPAESRIHLPFPLVAASKSSVSRMKVRPPGMTGQTKDSFPTRDSRSSRRMERCSPRASTFISDTMSARRVGETEMVIWSVLMTNPRISITRAGKNVLAAETGTPRSLHTRSQSCI